MSEVPNTQPTPAEQLGLVDGQFIVRRSGDTLEQGWNIDMIHEGTFPNDPDTVVTAARISRLDETTGQVMLKDVNVAELQSWQPQPETEDDGLDAETVPRERIRELGGEAVEQVVDAPEPVTEDAPVADESYVAPETAQPVVDGEPEAVSLADELPETPVNIEAPVEPDGADDTGTIEAAQADEATDDQAANEGVAQDAQDDKEPFVPKEFDVAEIAERLRLPRESEPKAVENKLREQITQLEGVFRTLHDFSPVATQAAREISATLSAGRNQLTGLSRNEINGFLHGPYRQLSELAKDSMALAAMPASFRNAIQGMQGEIVRFNEFASVMMGSNAPRGVVGAFDDGPAPQVLRTLGMFDGLMKQAAMARQAAEDELAQVIGHRRVNEEYEARQAEKQPPEDVFDVLKRAEKTDTIAIRVKGELRDKLAASLGDLSVEKPTDEDILKGAAAARQKIAGGLADTELAAESFMDWPSLDADMILKQEKAVWLDEPIYIDPRQVRGAVTFESWMGRGRNGQDGVSRREGEWGTRTSIDQIKDYASRDTAIPPLGADGGMKVVYAKNGTFIFSENAHRAAAAKLRGEPIPVEVFDIVRYDGEL